MGNLSIKPCLQGSMPLFWHTKTLSAGSQSLHLNIESTSKSTPRIQAKKPKSHVQHQDPHQKESRVQVERSPEPAVAVPDPRPLAACPSGQARRTHPAEADPWQTAAAADRRGRACLAEASQTGSLAGVAWGHCLAGAARRGAREGR
jgi:hypothetical protein